MPDTSFREITNIDLRPSFMSLGLPADMFREVQNPNKPQGFSAALNGPGDRLWLFKGSDYFQYNLRTDEMERGPESIATHWAQGFKFADGDTGPNEFANGIDAAFSGGPTFKNFWYFFRNNEYIRVNSSGGAEAGAVPESTWAVDQNPLSVEDWVRPFGSSMLVGKKFVGIHGIRQHRDKIHFFQDQTYMLHNLLDGNITEGPVPVRNHWPFPENFGAVELAFYGTGEEEDHIFFISDQKYVQCDTRSGTLVNFEAIEKRFPALAIHMMRPQLFLVEDYSLETYAGPTRKGRLEDTIITPARSKSEFVLISQIVTKAQTVLRQNVLQSQDSTTTSSFYQQEDNKQDATTATDSYRYRMNAIFHGEASAKGLWGGEVDANLNVEGGTDEQRDSLSRSLFETASSQVAASTHTLSHRAVSAEEAQELEASLFRSEKKTFDNSGSDRTLETQIFSVIEPYVTLLTLKNVRAAYTNGMKKPEIFSLVELERKLPDILSEDAQPEVQKLIDYLRHELGNVVNVAGNTSSILDANSPWGLRINTQIRSRYSIDMAPNEAIETKGILKRALESFQPTFGLTAEDRHLS